jgi:hypothetical protein
MILITASGYDDYTKRMTGDFDNMGNRSIIGNKDWTKCEL